MVQQKVETRVEALEEAIRMEESHVGGSNAGITQVQSKLVALTLRLQDISKMKEKMENV